MNESYSNINEDITTLKQYVLLRHKKEDIKIISISSVARGESKTNLSIKLAESLAEENEKTLLIDLDLYSPGIFKRLNISDNFGITDYVGKIKEKEDITININKNLDVILTGSEIKHIDNFLTSRILSNNILDLSKDYDLIIINNSPMNSIKDAEGPSNYADSVILCIAENFDSKKDLLKVKGYLDSSSLQLMGIVMTNTKAFTREDEEPKVVEDLVFNNKVDFKPSKEVTFAPKKKDVEAKPNDFYKIIAENKRKLHESKREFSTTELREISKAANTRRFDWEDLTEEEDEIEPRVRKVKKTVVKKAPEKTVTKKVEKPVKKVVPKNTKVVSVKKSKPIKEKPTKAVTSSKPKVVLSEKDRIRAALAKQKFR